MFKFQFQLFPVNGQVKPYEIPFGHIFQGVIFGWLHENVPRLTHELHAYRTVRPYAINCHIHTDKPLVEFTIVSYRNSLSSALIDICRAIEGESLEIAGKKYRIQRIQFEKVLLEKIIQTSNPMRCVHISFITPVHFQTSRGDYPVRFPLPSLFFGSLAHLWNDVLNQTARIDQEDFLNWLNAHCYPSRFKMRSARYFITTTQKVAGGQGYVNYRIKRPNEHFYDHLYSSIDGTHSKSPATNGEPSESKREFVPQHYQNNCRWVDILCRVGEYTNVGGNRTAGMGVMRYDPKEYLHTTYPPPTVPTPT